MSDIELLLLLRSDPGRGLSAVVERYSAYVMKIAMIKLNGVCSREDIEEAVSDIFYLFYTGGSQNGFEIRSLRAYLSLIAERHCINVFKSKCRDMDTVPFDEVEERFSEEVVSGREADAAYAVSQLKEPDRTIFVRKYFFGQRTKDIAKDLGMNANTVDKRISRGLVRLRKILEEG